VLGVVTSLYGMGVLPLSLDADRPPAPAPSPAAPSPAAPSPAPAEEPRRDGGGASWFSIRSLLRGGEPPAAGGGGSPEAGQARRAVAGVVEGCDVGGLLGEMRFLPEEGLVAVLHTLVHASAAALAPPDGPAGPAGPGGGVRTGGVSTEDWELLPLRLAVGLAGLNRDRVDAVWGPLVPHLSDVLSHKPPAPPAWQLRAADGLMALAGYAAASGGARARGQVERVLRMLAGLPHDALHPLAPALARRLTPLVRGRAEGLKAGGVLGGVLCLMGAVVTAGEGFHDAVQAVHEAVGSPHTHARTRARTQTKRHASRTCTRTRAHTCTRAHTHTCTRARVHTHTHTHTHRPSHRS
jgi:hypothetical protein